MNLPSLAKKHLQIIPSTIIEHVETKIDEIPASLGPYLLALTPRLRYPT
jgi:hypothetical protein